MGNEVERAISKKELRNQQDVTDVVISELIYELEDRQKELNRKCNDNETEARQLSAEALEELGDYLNSKYKDTLKILKTQVLDALGIKSVSPIIYSEKVSQDHYFFQKESFLVYLSFKNSKQSGDEDGRLRMETMQDIFHIGFGSSLSFSLKFSDLKELPKVTKCYELLKEAEDCRNKFNKLSYEIADIAKSKDRISTSFKRKTLEENDVTKQLLDQAKSAVSKHRESAIKLLGE
jgi:hypothetical protein